MKVYLAAAWSRQQEILEVAKRLEAVGVEITSNWLTQEKTVIGLTGEERRRVLRHYAYVDYADVDRADAIVRFTDNITPEWVMANPEQTIKLLSGARHNEFGYAKAKGKTLYVVGGYQNIFDYPDGVIHVKDVDELITLLAE